MDTIRLNKGLNRIELRFAINAESFTGSIALTPIRLPGIELAVAAKASYPPSSDKLEAQRETRLDLYIEKNGEPFRLFCYGPLLLCEDMPDADSRKEKFWIEFGSWE